jgi:hypothetical protein
MITGQEVTSGRIERRLPDRVTLLWGVSLGKVSIYSYNGVGGPRRRPSCYQFDLRLLTEPRRLLPESPLQG